MQGHGFLETLALVLGVATVTGVACHKLRLPAVLGFLLAGLLIGPHVTWVPLYADAETVHTLASLGVILIMFSLGLELRMGKLVRLATQAGAAAAFETSFMCWLGYLAGRALGFDGVPAVFVGALVAISSTMVIYRTLEERAVARETGDLVFGVLIFEDLAGMLLIAVLSVIARGQQLSLAAVGTSAAELAAILAALTVLGRLSVPRAMRWLLSNYGREVALLATIALCFGSALMVRAFGYSEALGAFLAGALAAESGQARLLRAWIQPLRELFGAVFFVSIGMLVDPSLLLANLGPILLLSGVVVVGKVVSVSLGLVLAGVGIQGALRAGACMTQIGEFSFLIAGVGSTLGEGARALYPLAVGVAVVTTLITPLMVQHADRLARRADELLPERVRLFATLWGTWLAELRVARARLGPAQGFSRVRRLIALALVDAGLVAAIVAATSIYLVPVQAALIELTGIPPWLAGGALIALSILACIPFGLGILRCVRRGGALLAERLLPAAAEGQLDLAAAPRRALTLGFRVALLLLIGGPLLAATQPFLPPLPGLLFLPVSLALLSWLLWRQGSDLQGHVRAGSQMLLEVLARQDEDQEPDLAAAQALLPGLGELSGVRIDARHPAVGHSLAEIDLRGRTGAGVLCISRGGRVLLPDARECLQAGDVLVVAGPPETGESVAKALAEGRS
jgi:CPA2 family monovalent cation:H+ antiporter-2